MIPFGRMLQYGNKGEPSIKKVASGDTFYVLLDSTGQLWGSGNNTYHQFGYSTAGTYYNEWVPVVSEVADVWCMSAYTIIKKIDGTIWYTGISGTSDTATSGFVQWTTELGSVNASDITDIYGMYGIIHVIVKGNTIYTIGTNVGGNNGLGIAAGTTITALTQVTGIPVIGIAQICYNAVSFNTFVRTSSGIIYCFGKNTNGELGKGNVTASWLPTIWRSGNYKLVITGNTGVVAILQTGSIYYICGNSQSGQLGNSSTSGTSSISSSITAVSTSDASVAGELIAPRRAQPRYNNAYMNNNGIYVTGSSPATLGATGVTDSSVRGQFGAYALPFPIGDMLNWSTTNTSTNLNSTSELYQCGTYQMIIDKTDTSTQIGFVKVRLPWENK